MNNKNIVAMVITIMISGCSAIKPMQYPLNGKNTTISVSSAQISALTESGSGDYFIKDSQITVGDAANLSNSVLGNGTLGLIGVGIATAIDKQRNASAISSSSLNTPIKFDQMLTEQIKLSLSQNQTDQTLKILELNKDAEIKVVPFARISFSQQPKIMISFAMHTRFKNALDNHKETKRTYHYFSTYTAPLTAWGENNNALFHQKATTAYTDIAKIFVLDIQNQLNVNKLSLSEQNRCQTQFKTTGYSFIDNPNQLCIAVLKNPKGQVIESNIYVFESTPS